MKCKHADALSHINYTFMNGLHDLSPCVACVPFSITPEWVTKPYNLFLENSCLCSPD